MSKRLGDKADRWKRYRTRHLPYIEKRCAVCGLSFQHTSNSQKRCLQCRHSTCEQCGVRFLTEDGRVHRFCSRRCIGLSSIERLQSRRGVKPRTYLKTNARKRGAAEDREWRMRIFTRDNFTCQMCGQRGGRLQADHIKPVCAFPELRHDLSNGRTLCVDCHKTTETYGSRARTYTKRLAQEVLAL